MLIDAHCHLNKLDETSFDGSVEAAWEHARRAGLVGCLIPSTVREDWPEIIKLTTDHDDLYGAIAIHPSERNDPPIALDEIVAVGSCAAVVAIGETGLDFVGECSEQEKNRQCELLELHIKAALRLNKPLIIHVRNAWPELLAILHRFPVDKIGGMVHCFTGDYQMAKAVLDLGWYISFSGIVTFKRCEDLRAVLSKLPLDRILLETDAPYLAPVPMRGHPNIPSYLRYTLSLVAEVLGRSQMELRDVTGGNFARLMLK